MKSYLHNLLCGLIIGICMLVPGVSGGTIAVILGIYNDLLYAGANIISGFKKSALLLLTVGAGGIIGVVSSAGIIGLLLKKAMFPTLYFFIGTILGAVYFTFSSYGKKEGLNYPMMILGGCLVFSLRLVPENFIFYDDAPLVIRFFIMIFTGIFLGAALILPGISFSMALMSLGIYGEFLQAISSWDFRFLLPIVFSTLFGIIMLSKILLIFQKKYPKLCNSLILGFVLASLIELFPGVPPINLLLYCSVMMILGLSSIFLLRFLKGKRA